MKELFSDFLNFFEKKHKSFIIFLFFLIIIGTFLETLSIAMIVPAINLITDSNFFSNFPYIYEVLSKISDFFITNNLFFNNIDENDRLIFLAVFLLVLVFILKTIFLIYTAKQQAHLIYLVNGHLSKKFFDGYITLNYPFFLHTHTSQLTHNINNEVGQLTTSINSFMTIVIEALVIICLVSLLIYFEPKASIIIILLFFSVSYLLHLFTRNKILKWGINRRLHQQKRLKHTQQGFNNIKNIKIFDAQRKFSDIYSYHNEIYSKMLEKHSFFQSLPRFCLELIVIISFSVLLLFVLVMQGKSISELILILGLYAAVSFRLLPSLGRILINLQNLRSFVPVIKNLKKEINKINLKINKEYLTKSDTSILLNKSIELKNINFAYKDSDKNILNDINLKISKGDKIGIKGITGAGKSTLTNLLLGLLKPTNGRITVDGFDIFDNLKDWRKLIGYVPQDVYLSDDTILNNICFLNSTEKVDREKFNISIKNSQIQNFIFSLKQKEDTIIGENGIRLSGGQKQRLGIARALYRNPKVLILDEATSALDINTEDNLIKTIFELNNNLTLIIISHRINTLKKCNKIYEIENGKINKIVNN
tara:strand:+ start:1202 stop:2980 length:1779 start_codon:yes stop_codon:yes gene_type:complete